MALPEDGWCWRSLEEGLPVGQLAAASLDAHTHQLNPGFVTAGTTVLLTAQGERGWSRGRVDPAQHFQGVQRHLGQVFPQHSIPTETSEAAV